jgi:hypothetical protein
VRNLRRFWKNQGGGTGGRIFAGAAPGGSFGVLASSISGEPAGSGATCGSFALSPISGRSVRCMIAGGGEVSVAGAGGSAASFCQLRSTPAPGATTFRDYLVVQLCGCFGGGLCTSSGHSLSTTARISSEMASTPSISSMYLCKRSRSADG